MWPKIGHARAGGEGKDSKLLTLLLLLLFALAAAAFEAMDFVALAIKK